MDPSAPPEIARAPSTATAGRRRAVLVAVLVIIGCTALGIAWGKRQDARHEATAVILLNPLVGSPFSPDSTRDDLVNLETEAHLVTSDPVARLVGERVAPGVSVAELLDGVSVEVPPNTQLLEISAQATSSALAAQRAQAFAQTYLDHRKARSESELFDRGAQVDEQIRERSRQLAERAADLGAVRAGSPQALLLQQETVEITSQIGQLRTQRAALQAQPSNPGQVVTPAAAQAEPFPGWVVLGGGSGFLVGVAGSVVLAVARTRRDPTRHGETELAAALAEHGVPVLGRSDAPHDVRTGLLVGCPQRPLVVLLASIDGGPGSLVGALGLATSLALSELETVLVDLTDPAAPGGVDLPMGLTDLLQESITLEDLRDEGNSGPVLLGAGSHPHLLDDLASAPRMREVVEELRKRADVVLLGGGRLTDPRTRALIPHADTAVLETGRVSADQLAAAVGELRRGGCPVAGVVTVRPTDASGRRERRQAAR